MLDKQNQLVIDKTKEPNLITPDKSGNVKPGDVPRFDFNDAEALLAKTRGIK